MFLHVLLFLRPAQNEVHPSHGGAHPGGHAGPWARAEESNHPHLLWYDAVRAQLQPRTHVWDGKNKKPTVSQVQRLNREQKALLAKYYISDVLNSLLIFAVWERTDNEIGSRGGRRPRGWAVQSPAGENVRQRSRSKGTFYSESCALKVLQHTHWKSNSSLWEGDPEGTNTTTQH